MTQEVGLTVAGPFDVPGDFLAKIELLFAGHAADVGILLFIPQRPGDEQRLRFHKKSHFFFCDPESCQLRCAAGRDDLPGICCLC